MKGSWERKIIDRVHNTKRRAQGPAVGAPQTKRVDRGRPKMYSVLSRYPPISGMSVDEVSVSRNIDKMKSEMKSSNPKKQILLPLMEETYPWRREMILARDSMAVSSILDIYPSLTLFPIVRMAFKILLFYYYQQIQEEISLILDKKNVMQLAIEAWKNTWVHSIIEYSGTIKTKAVLKAKEDANEIYKGKQTLKLL